ncbi:MAG: bifunctional nuclease family protein [Candidatus Nanopelagicales bacterium]|nr:bifunctional nuclease family protein [Candidatus Nanopelagicales bacterium]
MIEVEVVGVRVEMPANQPVLLLREVQGARFLPIWIGAVEATAIAFAQQGVEAPRPLTHDLIKDLLDAFDHELVTVEISNLDEGVFYANLNFADGSTVSARPSDAVALALRTGAKTVVDEQVMDTAGVDAPEEEEDEVEAFREFLDTVSPEDFGGGQQPPDA